MNQLITLQLTLNDINLVLESLGQMPFVQVHQLIGNIQQQAAGQLGEASPSHLQETNHQPKPSPDHGNQ
jgi:hypothetical protein